MAKNSPSSRYNEVGDDSGNWQNGFGCWLKLNNASLRQQIKEN